MIILTSKSASSIHLRVWRISSMSPDSDKPLAWQRTSPFGSGGQRPFVSETSTKRVLLKVCAAGTLVMTRWLDVIQLSADCVNVFVADCSDDD